MQEKLPTGPVTYTSSDEVKQNAIARLKSLITRLGGGSQEQQLEHQDGLIKAMIRRAMAGLNRQNREGQ